MQPVPELKERPKKLHQQHQYIKNIRHVYLFFFGVIIIFFSSFFADCYV